jgi:predicted transposase/invertase (TIGR01784 family)
LQDVYALEESKQMPYISTAEKLGIKKGIELGIEQGMERGIEQGIKREKIIIAKRLLSEGVDPAFITKITELTLEEVEALKQKSDKLETVV